MVKSEYGDPEAGYGNSPNDGNSKMMGSANMHMEIQVIFPRANPPVIRSQILETSEWRLIWDL